MSAKIKRPYVWAALRQRLERVEKELEVLRGKEYAHRAGTAHRARASRIVDHLAMERSELRMTIDELEVVESAPQCCICGGPIAAVCDSWRDGHNAQPVSNGRCCDTCNQNVVIPARLAEFDNRRNKS